MNLSRLFLVISLILLPAGWLQADTIDPTHFFFNLNDFVGENQDVSNPDPSGAGGWGAGNSFFVNNFNGEHPNGGDEGFFEGSITLSCNVDNVCTPVFPEFLLAALLGNDPHVGLSLGGKSTPEDGPFTFFANENGGGAGDGDNPDGEPFRFQNVTGFHINSLEVDTSVETSPGQTLTFICDGTAFATCGFTFGTGDIPVHVFFFDGPGIDSASVPEPSTWLLLGTAAAALIGRRALKHS